MAFYKQDIVDVNLETGVIHRSFLNHTIGHKDDDADRFGIRAFRNGEPVDLSGAQCQAVFMAHDGTNIALTSYGTVSGNEAYVTLPQACYDVEGQFCIAIKLVGGGVTATVRIIDGVVDRTGATGAVAPTEAVPTYQEILAVYAEMQEDVADYESVVATQNGKIDDLKSAFDKENDKILGIEWYFYEEGIWSMPTNNTDPCTYNSTATGYKCCKIPCVEGDTFTLKTYGASGVGRAWAFVKNDMVVVSSSYKAAANVTYDGDLTAPENSAFLLLNTKLESGSDYFAYKGKSVIENYLHDAKITIGSGNVSTYGDCDSLPANQYFVILANAVTGGFAHAAFDTTHTLLTIGTTTQIAFNVPVSGESCIAMRTKSSNAWQAWQYVYDSDTINKLALPVVAQADLATKYSGHLKNVAENCVTIAGTSSFDDTPEGHSGLFVSIRYGSIYYLHLFFDTTTERVSWGVTGENWHIQKDTHYDLYPTGDDTPRDADIALNCTSGKTLNLAPGEYYFDTMAIGGHLNGAGMDQTKLIFKDFDSSNHNYALRLRAHGMLTNLTVEKYQASGDITPVEDYTLGQNGIRIEGTGNDDTQRFACTVENVRIKNFEGCGLYIANTGYNPASGSLIHNVRVEFCSCGIFLGTFAEFCTVSDCWANYCYTGHVIMGANNTTSGCDFSMNKIGIAFPDTNGANDAHGIVQCCHIVHTGWSNSDPDWSAGYIMKIGAQQSSEPISNCIFANGKILIKDRASNAGPFFMTGCDFKKYSDVIADNCALNILSSFMAGSASFSVLNGGLIRRRNCFSYAGVELDDVT